MFASPASGSESVAVATFALRRAFRPHLWDEAVAEVHVVARDLAERLSSSAELSNGKDTVVAGRRARVYEIRYERAGDALLERVAFLFSGRREFQLTCRIDLARDDGESACRKLFASFRV